jgi:hypothetical protein
MALLQERKTGTMAFSLARQGALKVLHGQWTVTSHPTSLGHACIHLEQACCSLSKMQIL